MKIVKEFKNTKKIVYKGLIVIVAILTLTNSTKAWNSLPLTTTAQFDDGIQGGEGGQTIYDMKIAKSNSNRIYAATDTMRFWVSSDGGNSWENKVNGYRTKGAVSFDISPSDENIVVAAGSVHNTNFTTSNADGIYRTIDGGSHWALVYPTGYIRDYGQDNILFLNSSTVYAGTHQEGLLKSIDAGETWNSLHILEDRKIEQVLFSSDNPNKLFIGTENGLFTLVNDITLTQIGGGLPDNNILALAVDYNNGDSIYAVVNRTVYKSVNGGINFSLSNIGIDSVSAPSGIKRIEISPVDSTHLWCSRESKLYRSIDSGATWTSVVNIDPEGYMSDLNQTNNDFAYSSAPVITLSNVDSNLMFSSGNGHYVIKSIDGGEVFHYSASGFYGVIVDSGSTSFIWDKNNPSHYALAVTDFGVMQTFNNGQSFSNTHVPRINNAKTASVGVFDPDNNQRIITAVGGWNGKQIVVSIDGGTTWTIKSDTSGTKAHPFAAYNPQQSNEVYLGKWFSDNDGDVWAERDYIVRAMFTGDGNIVYAATITGTTLTIHKSIDKGVHWTEPYSSINIYNNYIREIAIDPIDQNRIYVATDVVGLLIWNGTSWEIKNSSNGIAQDNFSRYGIKNVVVDPLDQNIIYLGKNSSSFGHSNGIFKSVDRGNTWVNITEELGPDLNVLSIGINPLNRSVYLGTMAGNYIYDVVSPTLTEITPVSTPTSDSTPDYTFNSNEPGAITYTGDCSSSTTAAVSGNNTITFNTLADGLHSNCIITVTDSSNNTSTPLTITPFTINISSIRADVDQQNGINSTDAMLTLRNSLGLTMSSTNWQASSTTGDVNCDSNSNSTDALLILRESLGLDMSGTGWCGS